MNESHGLLAGPDFDKATPEDQRQILGDVIYTRVLPLAPDLACKIVVVFLISLDNTRLLRLVNDDRYLGRLVKQAKKKEEILMNAPEMPLALGSSRRVRYRIDKDYVCGVCADDKEKGDPYLLAAGDPVCKDCFFESLKPKFEAALDDEEQFPVQWGKADLSPLDFPTFNTEFLASWETRVKKYNTPLTERILCQHLYYESAGIGTKKACTSADYERRRRETEDETGQCLNFLGSSKNTKGTIATCSSCEGSSCGSCGLAFDPSGETHEHKCDPSRLGAEPEIDKTLIRGRDFQICPGKTYRRYYNLWEGCNAMVCEKCRTQFCYICGEEADHDSDHWGARKPCPRWNQPGSRHAMHDRGPRRLVIEPRFDVLMDQLMAQAAHPHVQPPQRRMILDQRQAYGTVSHVRAERIWHMGARERLGISAEMTRWVMEDFDLLEELLNSMAKNMDFYLLIPERKFRPDTGRRGYPRVTETARLESKESLRAFRIIRLEICGRIRRLRENPRTMFPDEIRTIFDMFPQLNILFDNWLAYSAMYIARLIVLAKEVRVPDDDLYMDWDQDLYLDDLDG
ncbi:hypothetical protein LTR35_002729 [Friedmanniomyces endolithicus]|uniref:RING-type domain-containing protein n=1 Tax=Friedmanniomyces endolithicus TaxID=329885 RepID=A0AAN6G3R5_9PEZI|nr:hypothetical protein LTS00_009994 [Friedmanniomyces endolithicus]KAK0289532.1 hypothetical protein LTR35_002729 [Friedmanniomyces endolithicus]KAK0328695.1 hypothetical protein LTR82_000627 [Friedmanniomyces endolithicus]KAK1019611.1 hypothetical protein LTR54_000253 [Friedmanniomyces endolithicus]